MRLPEVGAGCFFVDTEALLEDLYSHLHTFAWEPAVAACDGLKTYKLKPAILIHAWVISLSHNKHPV